MVLETFWIAKQQLQTVCSPHSPAMRCAGPQYLLWGTVVAQPAPPAGEAERQSGPCPLLQGVDYTAESAALVGPPPLFSLFSD